MRAIVILIVLCSNFAMAEEPGDKLKEQWKILAADYEKSNQDLQRYAVGDRLTPWFPKSWPVNDTTKIVRYLHGYSYTMPPSIVDGEMIIAPWAEIDYFQGTQKVIAVRLEDLGIQGVRPLSKEESIILNLVPEPNQLFEGNRKKLKEFYCLWIKQNSVLWKSIRHKHREFHIWLKCNW